MGKIAQDIRFLYGINLMEGEGIGTAYEYYTKLRKLAKFIESIEKPRKMLIAGLPEKYGLSMDFFLLGQKLQAEIVAVDDRPEVLRKGEIVYQNLKTRGYFDDTKAAFLNTDQLAELSHSGFGEGQFDIALSSEVFQRLGDAQETYIASLKGLAKNYAIFAPNGGNKSHANLSGLKSVYLIDLLKDCKKSQTGHEIYDYGFLDMPPFPPGLSRSKEKRMQAAESRLETFLMKGLEIYCLCEYILPKFVKEKIAHIVYVMAKNE